MILLARFWCPKKVLFVQKKVPWIRGIIPLKFLAKRIIPFENPIIPKVKRIIPFENPIIPKLKRMIPLIFRNHSLEFWKFWGIIPRSYENFEESFLGIRKKLRNHSFEFWKFWGIIPWSYENFEESFLGILKFLRNHSLEFWKFWGIILWYSEKNHWNF